MRIMNIFEKNKKKTAKLRNSGVQRWNLQEGSKKFL